MNPTNPNASICLYGLELGESVGVKVVLIIKCVICVIGILVWTLFLLSKPWKLILHMNARVLICYHAILCCLLLAVNLPMHVEHMTRVFASSTNPCDYMLPRKVSFYYQFTAFCLIFFQAITNAIFAIERITCTVNYRFYERKEYPKTIITLLLISTCLLTFGMHAFLAEGIDWNTLKLGFTTRDKNNQYATKTILIFIFCIEVITICSFQAVHFVNKRNRYRLRHGNDMKTYGCELSIKLQIRESITVTEMWTPIAAMHCLIFLIASGGLFINLWVIGGVNNEILQVVLGESVSMNIVYSVLLPIYVLAKNPDLFWNSVAMITRDKVKREQMDNTNDKDSECTQYFDNLKFLFTHGSADKANTYDGQPVWKFCCW